MRRADDGLLAISTAFRDPGGGLVAHRWLGGEGGCGQLRMVAPQRLTLGPA